MKNNSSIIIKSSLLCRIYSYLIKENDRDNIDVSSDRKRSFWYILCGITITITDKFIEYKQRNWYLIGYEKRTFHFQNISGIDIDKRLIGAEIAIFTTGSSDIMISGFSKKNADKIYAESSKFIHANSQRNLTDTMADKIVGALNKNSNQVSVTDELVKLKGLLDSGVVTQDEFNIHKERLLKGQ